MNMIRRAFTAFTFVGCMVLVLIIFLTGASYGATAEQIDRGVDIALRRFSNEVVGGRELLQMARGVLVFPNVIKAGLGIGGEYGEGALRVGGQTVDYYATAAGSMGIQLGGQTKMVIICFMEEEALKNFRNSSAWKAGVDASAVAISFGAGTSVDTIANGDPVVGFIFGQQGLMFDANLEGGKLTKLKR
jgi:lipid-binding SYLF domain-containing protein